jgi:hypothetical protein
MNHTQQLFNSAERKGSGTDGGGIKGQVGGVYGYPSLHLGLQLDHATTAQLRMGRHRNQGERTTTQRVPRINDGDSLFRHNVVTDRGSYLVAVFLSRRRPDR